MSAISVKQGHTQTITASVVDSSEAPYDLTGYTATMVIQAAGRLSLVGVVAAPATGDVVFSIPSSAYLAELQPGRWPYEVWIVSGPDRIPVLSGTLVVIATPQV